MRASFFSFRGWSRALTDHRRPVRDFSAIHLSVFASLATWRGFLSGSRLSRILDFRSFRFFAPYCGKPVSYLSIHYWLTTDSLRRHAEGQLRAAELIKAAATSLAPRNSEAWEPAYQIGGQVFSGLPQPNALRNSG